MSTPIGQTFGRFHILGELAAERDSIVFRAYDPTQGMELALTVVNVASASADQDPDRALEQAGRLLGLRHPHLVPVVEVGLDGDHLYLASPLLDAPSLAERLSRGPIEVAEAARYFEQIASALEFAHIHGVYHLALQPAHILIDRHGNALIARFGLAIARESWNVKALTQTGGELHRAPEQEYGGEGDAQSDQYALGVLLFRMLTGYTTFSSGIPVADMILRMNERSARLTNRPGPIPGSIAAIIMRATARDTNDRYASVREMNQAFHQEVRPYLESRTRLLEEPESQRVATVGVRTLLAPSGTLPSRRMRLRLGSIAALLAVLLGGLALLPTDPNHPDGRQASEPAPVLGLDEARLTDMAGTIEALSTLVVIVETGTAEIAATGGSPGGGNPTAPAASWSATPTIGVTPTQAATTSGDQTQMPAWSPTPTGGAATQPPPGTAYPTMSLTSTGQAPPNPPTATHTAPPPVPTQTSPPPTNTLPTPTSTPILPLPTLPLPTLPLSTLLSGGAG